MLVFKGRIYLLVRVNELIVEVPPLQSVPIEKNFPKVFSHDLAGVLSEREIYFGIEFIQDTRPISFPPYRRAPA